MTETQLVEAATEDTVVTTRKTIILFSGEFDKVVAAFVIANGAAAMDDEVTMFFTFWSINALRRPEKVAVSGKTPLQKMFSVMMPRGAGRLATSHMNFAGAGPKLMKRMMREQKVMSLDDLIASAREQGVKMVVCQMSMDIMGLKAEELIDDLEFAGVASYLGDADEANVNLFI
ncbi:MAG TPA: DsrE/DsrF/DrsH-like family protein [Dermatophilaceae bacterium]|jgi:peroxiredoxin family protein|nr:DsrE/DsrF/DrsH-like family protein [Dermatophilaceae bacterium]